MIAAVREAHPGFLFLAEAYWDLEWALQQQGFDACYDKRLYDRLADEGAEQVRGHLTADTGYQRRLVRFLENHDEPRAAAAFPPDRARVAAVTTLSQAGARLVHEGQLEGRRVRLPVFLGRRPDEPRRRGPAVVLRPSAAGRLGRRVPRRGVAARGAQAAGRATSRGGTSSHGAGGASRRRPSSSSISATSPPPDGSRCRGTTCAGARGSSPTRPRTPGSSGAATSSGTGSMSSWAPWHWHLFELTALDG